MKESSLSQNRKTLSGDRLLSPTRSAYEGSPVGVPTPEDNTHSLTLASGHCVNINHLESEIHVESPNGEISVRIVLSEGVPVIELHSANLNLQTIEDIEVNCRKYTINSNENIEMHADGQLKLDSREEMKLSSEDDVRVNGKVIWLN